MQPPRAVSEPKAPRSLFWLAFAISFVLLAAASCGGVAMLSGLGDITLADLQSTGPVWTPPPTPTSLPADATPLAAAVDANAQPDRLQPGGLARNVAAGRVNIRRSPGYLGKGDYDIVAQMEQGTIVTILEWPQAVDQLTWWYIHHDTITGPVEGWVAESTASGVVILAPE